MAKKSIKIGIWGIGRAGWGMHIDNELKLFPDEFELTAVCDILPDRLAEFQKLYPNVKIYQDSEEFLNDPEIELVSVAVPSLLHKECTIRALEKGKYVFNEKPVALSMEDAMAIKAAEEKHPGKLFFRHNRRFESCFNHIREIIQSGLIGELYQVKLCRHNFDFRADWQTLISCGGGQLNNWGPHLIDQALQFLDAPVESVWSDLKCIAARGDAEDHLKILLRAENGRVADIEISGGVALSSPNYVIYGTKGSIISEDEQDIKLKYIHSDYVIPEISSSPDTPPRGGSFTGIKPRWVRKTIMTEPECGWFPDQIYQHLYLAIRENVPFPVKSSQAYEVVRITSIVKQQNPQFLAAKK